jgi:hypothetical protein
MEGSYDSLLNATVQKRLISPCYGRSLVTYNLTVQNSDAVHASYETGFTASRLPRKREEGKS